MGRSSQGSRTAGHHAPAVRFLRRLPGRLALLAAVAIAGVMLAPALLGFERYVITGDSMSGEIDRGSIAFEREVAVAELRVGDVITYAPPAGKAGEGLVTHRIIAIRESADGPVFRTAGDANAAPDPWRFRLDGPAQPRVEFHVPYLGYAIAALSLREVRMLVIGLPALLVAFAIAARTWRLAGEGRNEAAAEGAR